MDHAAVAAGGLLAGATVAFEDHDRESTTCQDGGTGQADHTGTDHDRISFIQAGGT